VPVQFEEHSLQVGALAVTAGDHTAELAGFRNSEPIVHLPVILAQTMPDLSMGKKQKEVGSRFAISPFAS
jgi:hypothetical protein